MAVTDWANICIASFATQILYAKKTGIDMQFFPLLLKNAIYCGGFKPMSQERKSPAAKQRTHAPRNANTKRTSKSIFPDIFPWRYISST